MKTDELVAQLRRAANATPPIDDVPLDAIHARRRSMRRHRALAVSATAVVVAALVGGGIVGINRSGSSEIRSGVAAAPTTTVAPGRGGITLPTAEHYYKATVTLVLRDHALLADLPVRGLDAVATLVDDGEFVEAVANATGKDSEWIRPRIDARARGEADAVDVTTIGTDPAATERLADAAADEVTRLVDERSAVSYRAQMQSLQAQIAALTRNGAPGGSNLARLVRLQSELSAAEARLAALDAPNGIALFTIPNRAKAIEINEAGFVARWRASVTRTDD